MLSFGFLIFIFINFVLNEHLDVFHQWQIFVNNKSTTPTHDLNICDPVRAKLVVLVKSPICP